MSTCEYNGCNKPTNSPHDDKLCVFHAPKDKKGISGDEFNKLIFNQIHDKDYNFERYIFPSRISFEDSEFDNEVNFKNAKFEGTFEKDNPGKFCVIFGDVNFKSDVDFSGAEFSGGNVYFGEAKFSMGDADFREAKFSGGDANFTKAVFSGGRADFTGAKFTGGNVYFGGAKFSGGHADFIRAIFDNGFADFSGAEFSGGDSFFLYAKFTGAEAKFRGAKFSNNLRFEQNKIKCSMDFSDITLGDKSIFLFKNPEFIITEEEKNKIDKNIIIKFSGINFNPFATYFENINYPKNHKKTTDLISPVIIFRYCQLKNVNFADSDMSLFSFYKSIWEEARYYSCGWKAEKRIFEERIYDYVNHLDSKDRKEEYKKNYEIEDLNYNEIAALYRRFKTVLDNTKDYAEAGRFYFNEIEMKRKNLWDEIKEKKWPVPMTKILYSIIYLSYKKFTGYGEKPVRSFLWFLGFIFTFSISHLFNGLKYSSSKNVINYDWALSLPGIQTIWNDWLIAIKYTLACFIPKSFLPEQWANISSAGWFVSLLNSLVLILFVIFIGIGLKRHFRRF